MELSDHIDKFYKYKILSTAANTMARIFSFSGFEQVVHTVRVCVSI